MSWLANLDAKARRWPAAVRWAYHGLKWLLIAVGTYAAVGTAYIEVFREHRVGLGSGVVVACALALIKGVLMAVHQTSPPPDSPRPH